MSDRNVFVIQDLYECILWTLSSGREHLYAYVLSEDLSKPNSGEK